MSAPVPDPRVWHSRSWPPLPRLDGGVTADVCVVGAGGSGLACARELLSLGRSVVMLDAGAVAGGAAGSNGGFLLAGLPSFHHDAEREIGPARARVIYRLTMAELDRMAAETPAVVRRLGSLRIADTPAEVDDCARQFASMRAADLPVEHYAGPEGHGLLIPTDGAFHPLARCRTLAERALAGGARIFEQSAAREIGDGRVTTDHGTVRCRHVVVAVDGGLELLLPVLATRVRSARLQMIATAPATDVLAPRPVYRRWGLDYWHQLPNGRIALGGGRDVGGEAEWTTDRDVTPVVQHYLENTLREQVGTTAPTTHRWAATVAFTTDHMPVVDQIDPRVWVIGGYSGTGNVLGALLGRGVAQTIVNGTSPLLAPFLPTA